MTTLKTILLASTLLVSGAAYAAVETPVLNNPAVASYEQPQGPGAVVVAAGDPENNHGVSTSNTPVASANDPESNHGVSTSNVVASASDPENNHGVSTSNVVASADPENNHGVSTSNTPVA